MVSPTPPTPRRRRVVLDSDAPTPVPWGEDERLSRPVLPIAPPQTVARPTRAAPWSSSGPSRERATAHRRRISIPRPAVPRSRRLRVVLAALVILAVLAAALLVTTAVLLGRSVS